MAAYTMYRGDTFYATGRVLDVTGANYDLTGAKMWMTAKEDKDDADVDAIFQVSSPASGIDFTSPTTGAFTIIVPNTETEVLTDQAILFYDIQIEDTDGNVFTINTGTITVLEDVTRTTV